MAQDDHGGKELNRTLDEQIGKVIDAKKEDTRRILKEVEANFRKTLKAHIDFHLYMKEQANKRGDLTSALHHEVRRQVYQSIFDSYSNSNSYDTV